MNLFDASALLAFLQNERGAVEVERGLEVGGRCSAVNWSEVAQKVLAAGRDWQLSRLLLLSYDLTIEPVTEKDAEYAAGIWKAGAGLSLADRLCLAVGYRLGALIWTADAQWGTAQDIRQIR